MSVMLQPRPTGEPRRPWSFPPFERLQLDNGLQVVMCHLPDRPVLEVCLILEGGAVREPSGAEGIGAIASRVVMEGPRSSRGFAFLSAVEALGARMAITPQWHALLASISMPVSHMALGLRLLAQAITDPALREEDIERHLRKQRDEVVSRRQFPGPRAAEELAAGTFAPGVRMARPIDGAPGTLDAVDPDAVRRFWFDHALPSRGTAIVVGDLRGTELGAAISDAFGDWEGSGDGFSGPVPAQAHAASPSARLVEVPGAVQTQLVVGQAAPPPPLADRPALRVAAHYLGGFFSSRLNTLLREQKAITYGARASLAHRSSASVLRVDSAVHAVAGPDAAADVRAEVEDLAAGNVERRTFEAAVDNLVTNAPIGFQSAASVAGALAGLVVDGLPDDYHDWSRQAMLDITAAEVAAAFARHVRPGEQVVVAVGDVSGFGADPTP